MLSKELTLIVDGITRSFTESGTKDKDAQEVVVTETSHCREITSDNLNMSNSALIEEHLMRELEYDDLENGSDVIFASEDSQLSDQPKCDSLSDLTVVKSESLQPVVKLVPLILKTEKSFENSDPLVQREISPVSFFVERENSLCSKCNLSSDTENHVCLFKCDLCAYAAEYSCTLGQHKRRVHKIFGKSNRAFLKKKHYVFGQGKRFQCNLCPYTARTTQIIGQHKRRVHKIVGIRSVGSVDKSSTVGNKLPLEEENSSEKLNQENTGDKLINYGEKKQLRWTRSSRDSGVKEYKCNSCPFVTVSNSNLRSHKWRKHNIQKNSGSNIVSSSKVFIRCDLCSFTTKYMKVLSRHKKLEHKVSGKTSKDKIETSSDKTVAPEKCTDVENQNQQSSKDELPSCVGDEPLEKTQDIDDSRTVGYKCDFCLFTSPFKKGLRLHILRKHNVEKPRRDRCTPKETNKNEEKPPKNYSKNKNIKFKKQFYNFPRYIQFSSNSSATTSFVSTKICGDQGNLTEDQLSVSQNSTPRSVHDIICHNNEDESHARFEFNHQDLKLDEIEIVDDVSLSSNREPYATFTEDLNREPMIVHTESLDEDAWIDIEENTLTSFNKGRTEMCPKCNLSYDPNNHTCLFKCDLCSFTSKYGKVIVKHKLRQHKVSQQPLRPKSKNQSATGKLFKCDLCSFTSIYIQCIGKHKRKIHNVTGQASEEFLMKKKCIIGSKRDKLFKCEYCSFTAKYIQNIGVHKKQIHKEKDKSTKESIGETTAIQTEDSERVYGTEAGNQEIQNTPEEDSWIDVSENTVPNLSEGKEDTCPKCNMSYEPKNHICSFKCDLCSFTSKYRKVVVRHKLRQHKNMKKLKNQSVTGKLFKCDLCSYTSRYIQSIGKHKSKVHNIIGQASEEFLMKKKCVIGSERSKLFKCEYCSFTAKYIQNIGVHKKQMHRAEDKPTDESTTETSSVNTKLSNMEIVNSSYKNKSKDALRSHQKKKHNIKRKMKSVTGSADGTQSPFDPETNEYKCKSCPYQTNTIGSLRMHRWLKHNDNRKIKRTVDQAAKEQGARKVKIGSQERFICRCRKMYKNKMSLYTHMKYHCMQERRHCCHLCNYKSHRRSEVYRHLRQKHKLKIPYMARNFNINVDAH